MISNCLLTSETSQAIWPFSYCAFISCVIYSLNRRLTTCLINYIVQKSKPAKYIIIKCFLTYKMVAVLRFLTIHILVLIS